MCINRSPVMALALAAASMPIASPASSAPASAIVDLTRIRVPWLTCASRRSPKPRPGNPFLLWSSPNRPAALATTWLVQWINLKMKDAVAPVYLVRLNVSDWRGQLGPLRLEGRIQSVIYSLSDDARPDGRKIHGGAWGEFTAENMAPLLKSFFAGLK